MYRFLETIPGLLAWGTFAALFFLSWKLPAYVAVFIILFDIYWLLKTIYLSLHLNSSFRIMKNNLKINWLEKLKSLDIKDQKIKIGSFEEIYHLIILPFYNEPYDIVRESVESLIKTNYPKDKFIVVLASEERAGEKAQITAKKIKEEFSGKFFKLLITTHPKNIPREIPGKGSNETWSAKKAKELIDKLSIPYENILVSVFDIDTQVFPEYFGRLTYSYLTSANPLRAIYQPIPLYTNNIYQAPALARVIAFSSTFWQMMQQSRPEHLVSFSSQSIPFQTLVEVGFWETNVVSEDSRIFWQCYLRYHGDFRVEPLLYPVSMDANVASTLWQTMKNIYKQHRRWGWGAENIPYMLYGFIKDPLIPKRKKLFWTFSHIEGFHSWATNAIIIFALGWLPLIIGGGNFNYTLLSYNLPQITSFIIRLSLLGISTSAIIAIMLLPPRPSWFRFWHYGLYILQWALIPITLIIFGAIPGLEAQTRLMLGGKFKLGFWVTPKHRLLQGQS